MTDEQWATLEREVSKVFTPSSPINVVDLFAGRLDQLRQVNDAVNQPGQHAIIYGERGVGKTSLANVIVAIFRSNNYLAVRVNSTTSDNYSKLWRKVFDEIKLTKLGKAMGFKKDPISQPVNVLSELGIGDEIDPNTVRQVLTTLSQTFNLIIILDEFDRIATNEVKTETADTIKTLSDHSVGATIIIVGVADSVERLIFEHQSIERALVQVQMPRMSINERNEIIEKGLKHLKMAIDNDAMNYIANLSQGLPHYIHSLALHATRAAIQGKTKNITVDHVETAITKALEQAQESIKSLYHEAIASSKKNAMFVQVLLACALAETDSLGCFIASDVRDPLSAIMRRRYDIPSFARHLKEFCEKERGPILQRFGVKHRYRFRFANPLMEPFITMKGVKERFIEKGALLPKVTQETMPGMH